MQSLLTLKNVYFIQSGQCLLDNISLTLNKGEIVGLLGVNGAGKSTTLKIASGILTPTQGHVNLFPKATIGYLPEIPPVIENWHAKAFLNHICSLYNIPSSQRGGRIEDVITSCNLQNIINQPIMTLSKGNRQRVAIASAIIQKPDILILDEPTSGLDPQQISLFRSLITSLKADTAILFSSHIMHEITSLCDRVDIIHQGQKRAEIALKQQHQEILIQFFTDVACETLQKLPQWRSGANKNHQFSARNADEQQQLIKALSEMNLPIARITGTEKILEDTFLQLIGQTTNENEEMQ